MSVEAPTALSNGNHINPSNQIHFKMPEHDEATKTKLNESIMNYYRRSMPNKQRHESLKKLHSFITGSIKELLAYQEYAINISHKEVVLLFGSVSQTTMTNDSDLDMAVNIPMCTQSLSEPQVPKEQKEQRRYILKILTHLRKILDRKYQITYSTKHRLKIERVFTAKVPILRITEPLSDARSDISVASFHTKHTAAFMKRYTNHDDERIRPFIVFLKMFTKQRGINNGYKGYFNSFGITLLCIKYLQLVTPAILPIYRFSSDFDIIVHKEANQKENKMTLSELLCGFFNFYGHVFNPNECMISILSEEWQYKDRQQFDCKPAQMYFILQDPIKTTNNVAKNIRPTQWEHTRNVFKRGLRTLTDFDLYSDLKDELRVLNPNKDEEDVLPQDAVYNLDKSEENDENVDVNKDQKLSYLCGACYTEKIDGCIDEANAIWYCLDCWKKYNGEQQEPTEIKICDVNKVKPPPQKIEEVTSGYEANFVDILPVNADSFVCVAPHSSVDCKENSDANDSVFMCNILQNILSCDRTAIERIAAHCLMYLGNDKEAECCFKMAMEHNAASDIHYVSLFEYSCFLFDRNRFEEAEQYFAQLLEFVRNYEGNRWHSFVALSLSRIYLYYARVLDSMKANEEKVSAQYAFAIQTINKYDEHQDVGWIHYYYGLFLFRLKQYKEYECHLKKTMELNPNCKLAKHSIEYYEMKKNKHQEDDSIETVNNRRAFDRFWWDDIGTLTIIKKFNTYYDNFERFNMNDIRCVLFDSSIEKKMRQNIGVTNDDLGKIMNGIQNVCSEYKEFMKQLSAKSLMPYYRLLVHYGIYNLRSFNNDISTQNDLQNLLLHYNRDKRDSAKPFSVKQDAVKLSVLIDTLDID